MSLRERVGVGKRVRIEEGGVRKSTVGGGRSRTGGARTGGIRTGGARKG